jgi:hypothetical protein
MFTDTFYLFSKHGWMTKTSQWSTEFKKAAMFDRADAIERCRAYRENQVAAVPVSTYLMEVVNDKR